MASSFDASELDPEKLVAAIKKHNPTLISLSFCYTNVSDLNDILRSAGIYTVLIMSKDRANITEGKYVVLDPIQRYFQTILSKLFTVRPWLFQPRPKVLKTKPLLVLAMM